MINLDVFYGVLSDKQIIRQVSDFTFFTNTVADSLSMKPGDFMVRFLRAIDLNMYENIDSVSDKIESLGLEQFSERFENEFEPEMILSKIDNANEN